MKDYLVEFKVKNNRLKTLMRERGLSTVRELAAYCGVHDQMIYKLMNLKEPGRCKNGKWRPAVLRMADRLHCLPEEIIPPQHEDHPLAKNKAELEISFEEIEGVLTSAGPKDPLELAIDTEEQGHLLKSLDCLNATDRVVIEMRYGLIDGMTRSLREIGDVIGVSPTRVGQREMRALAKLRSNDAAGKLLDFKPVGNVRMAIGTTPERN